ncbi:Rqc2 family fibronectin-binding protein [Fundicoccus sp. Sow4_D5]|uniref:Rqc2 family fibronectin-binding protein n=1 Tax=unclassified Fundicoccus TaxID=2761543 RepID=UPI003F8E889D
MSFDGLFTHGLVAELKEQLLNGRVHKIYQPFEQELQFVIRANRKNQRLSASIHPTYYRLLLTEERPSNPSHAPMFCMLLRKHLENASILDIRQIENDRIIEFELSGRDELGDLQTYLLIFELMGRHSNIILVNTKTQTIIDCIKHVSPAFNSYRSLQPGAAYIRPPKNPNQQNILEMNSADLSEWVETHAEELTTGQGHRVIQGLSKMVAETIQDLIVNESHTPLAAIHFILEQLKAPKPTLFESKENLKFYAFDLPNLQGKRQSVSLLSDLLELFFQQKVHLDRVKQLSGDMIQKIKHIIDRNNSKLTKLAKERAIAGAADNYRIKGELLNAYAYQLQKGISEAHLENYYDENQLLTVELDPRKTPIENSQQYFKKYTKYRDSLKYIDQQETLALEENDYLEGVLVQLSQADLEDIEMIKQELTDEGYVSQRKGSVKKRAKSKSKPRRYRSSDGIIIYVGRNNQQNDELSLRKAAKNHWWFHTKDIPGAHVIVESDKPSEQTMQEAAEIAAYFSKFQQSANVPVDTVQVKQLHKPNGAKPGFVIYEGQQTLYVTPVESKISAMAIED